MEETLYFAYGSNINLEQMEHRCPDAQLVGPVTLQNYELQFRGSGFAVSLKGEERLTAADFFRWIIRWDQ